MASPSSPWPDLELRISPDDSTSIVLAGPARPTSSSPGTRRVYGFRSCSTAGREGFAVSAAASTRNRLESLAAEIVIERESRPQAEPAHDEKAGAVHEAEMTAVGGE